MKFFFTKPHATKTIHTSLAFKTKFAVGAAFTIQTKITVIAILAMQTFVAKLAVIYKITIDAVFVVQTGIHKKTGF